MTTPPPDQKWCRFHAEYHTANDFYYKRHGAGVCKSRQNADNAARVAANPEARRVIETRSRLKTLYSLTLERYQQMLLVQGGVCALCLTSSPGGKNDPFSWSVDHDHSCCVGDKSCGKCVRGLLCGSCNRALGLIKDNRSTAERMVRYLV